MSKIRIRQIFKMTLQVCGMQPIGTGRNPPERPVHEICEVP
jgi:hypothetical protein